MNAPRLTDDRISQALRAHLPDRAQAGLRDRILETAETTTQQRALPAFLGGARPRTSPRRSSASSCSSLASVMNRSAISKVRDDSPCTVPSSTSTDHRRR